MLRCDLGTENSDLKHLHPLVVHDPSNKASVKYGKSTKNQRIEAWWSVLRKSFTNWWMKFFTDLRDSNFYNDGNKLHVECLKFFS